MKKIDIDWFFLAIIVFIIMEGITEIVKAIYGK